LTIEQAHTGVPSQIPAAKQRGVVE